MIKGKLVGLRAIETEDLETLLKWRNKPDFRRNFRETRELNMKRQTEWFEKVNNSTSDFMFAIEDLKTGELIGAGGLLFVHWLIRFADFSLYIGYEDSYVDDKGYAEDATDLLLQYGFEALGLNKVWVELFEFDEKKIKLLSEKCGFTHEGTLRDNIYKDGKHWNTQVYSILRREYYSDK